jgi:hypothetical protein
MFNAYTLHYQELGRQVTLFNLLDDDVYDIVIREKANGAEDFIVMRQPKFYTVEEMERLRAAEKPSTREVS